MKVTLMLIQAVLGVALVAGLVGCGGSTEAPPTSAQGLAPVAPAPLKISPKAKSPLELGIATPTPVGAPAQ